MSNYLTSDSNTNYSEFSPRAINLLERRIYGELGPQKNENEETRLKITQKDYVGGSGLIGLVSRVCYGRYHGKRACIIVLQFLFRWTRDEDRFTHGEIEVCFKPYKSSDESGRKSTQSSPRDPIVRNVSPGKVYGRYNQERRKWTLETEKACAVRLKHSHEKHPSSLKSSGSVADESHILEIKGERWSDSRNRDFDKACLVIDESGNKFVGIPEEVNVAVLVECESDFQARVQVDVDISWDKKLNGFPWTADDPLLFIYRGFNTPLGYPILVENFENLVAEDWKKIVDGDEVMSESLHAITHNPVTPPQYKIYRVQGIPRNETPNTLKEFLCRILDEHSTSHLDLRAFAPDPRCTEESIAVVGSTTLSSKLIDDTRWNFSFADVEDGSIPRMHNVLFDNTLYDMTPLHIPDNEPLVDIIAMSGLGAHSFGSFKESQGTYMWLADDLPRAFPFARIFLYGYDTRLLNSQSFQELDAIANAFKDSLKTIRDGGQERQRPLIFIVHSLGGLVLKQALTTMVEGDENDTTNAKSAIGILEFGVPNLGMNIEALRTMVTGQPNELLVHNLRSGSSMLRNLVRDFRQRFNYTSCRIVSFYETELSPTAKKGPNGWARDGEPAVMVTQDSATGGSRIWETGPKFEHALQKTHSNLVKYYPKDPCYQRVKYIIAQLVSYANL